MDINKDDLERALTSENQETEAPVSKEMEIGFHNGVLNTLGSERAELLKMVANVEKIMGMHIQRLEQLGVKVQKKE
jgi:hypothetical protein